MAEGRSDGALYSETGLSDDQVSSRCSMSVMKKDEITRMVSGIGAARRTDTIRYFFYYLNSAHVRRPRTI